MEGKAKIHRGSPSFLWILQYLHAQVRDQQYSLIMSCLDLDLLVVNKSEKCPNNSYFRVNLSVAVVAMTSNRTHTYPNGTVETVSNEIIY